MRLTIFFAVFNLGMGTQAAISAALFPNGIDPSQQLIAAVIFGAIALSFLLLDVVLMLGTRNGGDNH